jgi:AhpD family alkylhydroperoxidase
MRLFKRIMVRNGVGLQRTPVPDKSPDAVAAPERKKQKDRIVLMHYTHLYDVKNLEKLSALHKAVPKAMASFQAFDEAALADGAIPKKYKELMAVAVGLTTQCPYCIDVHRKASLNAGATEEELAEVTFIAAALRAGAAVTHGTHLID